MYGLQGGAVLNVDRPRLHGDAIYGVQLARYLDGPGRIDGVIAVLQTLRQFRAIIPGLVKMLFDQIHRAAGRRNDVDGTRVDHAAGANRHALFGNEEKIAAHRVVPDGVDGAVHIDPAVDYIDQVIHICSAVQCIETHIGNVPGRKVKLCVFTEGHIAVHFIRINVINLSVLLHSILQIAVLFCNLARLNGKRHKQHACRHAQRQLLLPLLFLPPPFPAYFSDQSSHDVPLFLQEPNFYLKHSQRFYPSVYAALFTKTLRIFLMVSVTVRTLRWRTGGPASCLPGPRQAYASGGNLPQGQDTRCF